MDKNIVYDELDELILEGRNKVLSKKWDYSDTDIIGFGTYVNEDVFCSWRMKTMSFLNCFYQNHTNL